MRTSIICSLLFASPCLAQGDHIYPNAQTLHDAKYVPVAGTERPASEQLGHQNPPADQTMTALIDYVEHHLASRLERINRPRSVVKHSGERALLYEVLARRRVIDTRLTPWERKWQFRRYWILVDEAGPFDHQDFGDFKKLKICKPPG